MRWSLYENIVRKILACQPHNQKLILLPLARRRRGKRDTRSDERTDDGRGSRREGEPRRDERYSDRATGAAIADGCRAPGGRTEERRRCPRPSPTNAPCPPRRRPPPEPSAPRRKAAERDDGAPECNLPIAERGGGDATRRFSQERTVGADSGARMEEAPKTRPKADRHDSQPNCAVYEASPTFHIRPPFRLFSH